MTKSDLADYFDAVAPRMLPHLKDRPLNLERWPDGLDGRKLFTQDAPKHTPDWVQTAATPKKGGSVDHVVARDAETLRWLAQQAAVTLHGWQSRADRLTRPDRLVFDLDPGDRTTVARLRTTARQVRGLLGDELGLDPVVMTSGSRGFHVVVPLQRRLDFEAVRAFARAAAQVLVDREPKALTLEFSIADRGGRLFLDVGRNAYAQSAVVPWSPRARPEGPVATPLHWDELDDVSPRSFLLADAARRARDEPDPWAQAAPQALGSARARLDSGAL